MKRPPPKWLGSRAKGAAGAHPEGQQPPGRNPGVINSAGIAESWAMGERDCWGQDQNGLSLGAACTQVKFWYGREPQLFPYGTPDHWVDQNFAVVSVPSNN